MTRTERIAVVVALGLAGMIAAIFATSALSWLNNRLEFSAGANVIQWLSGPATFAAVVVIIYGYFVRRCAMPLCVRRGEHPVDGTLKKVCHQHHTREHHLRVFHLHGPDHVASDRLNFGESHLTPSEAEKALAAKAIADHEAHLAEEDARLTAMSAASKKARKG